MKNTNKRSVTTKSVDSVDSSRRSALRTIGLFSTVPFIGGAWIGCGDSSSTTTDVQNITNFSTDLVLDGDVYTALGGIKSKR